MKTQLIIFSAGIILTFATSIHAEPYFKDGLIAYFSFDNPDNIGKDDSGNNYDAKVHGKLTSEAGKYGNAVRFPATMNEDVLNFLLLPKIDSNNLPTRNFTLSAWCYLPQKLEWTGEIFSGIAPTDDGKSFGAVHTEYGGPSKPRFALRNKSNKFIGNLKYRGGVAQNGWRNVTMTYDADERTMRIYDDGRLINNEKHSEDSAAMGNEIATWIDSRIGGTCPGTKSDGTVTPGKRQYIGAIDELYLFKRTLSPVEVGQLMYHTEAGDANMDGSVNEDDLNVAVLNYGQSGIEITWAKGDFNGDSVVNSFDLNTILTKAGQSLDGTTIDAGNLDPQAIKLLSQSGIKVGSNFNKYVWLALVVLLVVLFSVVGGIWLFSKRRKTGSTLAE